MDDHIPLATRLNILFEVLIDNDFELESISGEGEETTTSDWSEALSEAVAVEELYLHFEGGDWIMLVPGNTGVDVWSDDSNSSPTDTAFEEFENAIADYARQTRS